MTRRSTALGAALLAIIPSSASVADTAVLNPILDNTLYERPDGAISNGAGDHMFSGTANDGEVRRAVLTFDLSSIPPGATVSSVSLALTMTRTTAGTETHDLHRMSASWGEGSSDAIRQEGAGAPSADGDATWIHQFFPDVMWSTPGGSFATPVSASTDVADDGTYVWSGAGLISDVVIWLNDPDENFGWILIGNESNERTAKRFSTKDNPSNAQWPTLTIDYTPMSPTVPDSWSGVKSHYGTR